MIGVAGATGGLGSRVAARLAERGVEQRLIVRDPARAPSLPGAEVVQAAGYDDGEAMRPHLAELLRGALAQFVREDGTVVADASTWVVTASPA